MEAIVIVCSSLIIAQFTTYQSFNKLVFRDAQVLTHHLPPHSPDYNPIELAFLKVKYLLKAMEAEMQALQDIDMTLLAAFSQIIAADCCAWISFLF